MKPNCRLIRDDSAGYLLELDLGLRRDFYDLL
jgi:hypothetical protein